MNIEGDYNVENALAVINTGLYLEIAPEKINEGLKSYCPIEKRWQVEEIGDYKVINDAYNANPESMKASLSTVLELYPNSTIVLGDMGELGQDEVFYHQQIGDFILSKLDESNKVKIITVGNLAKEIAEKALQHNLDAIALDNNNQAIRYILDNVEKHTTIFLKASRAMKFEEIVNGLKGDTL